MYLRAAAAPQRGRRALHTFCLLYVNYPPPPNLPFCNNPLHSSYCRANDSRRFGFVVPTPARSRAEDPVWAFFVAIPSYPPDKGGFRGVREHGSRGKTPVGNQFRGKTS